MAVETATIDLGDGKVITIETGKIALLAHGAVVVTQGETQILVCACGADPRPGLNFFPLQVDYREKFSAAGRMPGGYFKREGRPSEKEILTGRMTDRPLRPLFPKGYRDDVQIMALLLCCDGENDSDVLCMLGASAALCLSHLPFAGPTGNLRVGRVNGKFIANPTHSEMKESDLDLVYAGTVDKTIMIEGACDELSEEELRDALVFANEAVKKLVAAQEDLAARAGREKAEYSVNLPTPEVAAAVAAAANPQIREISMIASKEERYGASDVLMAEVIETVSAANEDVSTDEIKTAYYALMESTIRRLMLDEGKRSDHRAADELRPISSEIGVLPRVHGSGLFARGETQALVIATLGAPGDSQSFDAITGGPCEKNFFLHYNFPNYSVGETGRIMGPGRREVGHGALAERSVARMMPSADEFPYSIRCVSEVMGSNGSTSMASVCGASLALMDAGVPIKKPVAGITCGLVKEGDQTILLTDILGSEDHYGDMDFKVAGTPDGITGFQLDLKIDGISIDLMYEALLRNKTSRLAILDAMGSCIATPREELNPNAPQIHTLKINPEKIGALIGPGGKVIRGLTSEYNCSIDIEDDGTVKVFTSDGDTLKAVLREIDGIVAEAEIGRIYNGTVRACKDFGAFVEILPGQDGLLHISEMADYRVKAVTDVCKEGDEIEVKVIDIDERGRIRLSRKAILAERAEAGGEPAAAE
jgi:polyribonucleotide nucleotidyltransferase